MNSLGLFVVVAIGQALAGAAGDQVPTMSTVGPWLASAGGLRPASQPGSRGKFLANLPATLPRPATTTEQRILQEYGALFLARGGVVVPPTFAFASEAQVLAFQKSLPTMRVRIGRYDVELQVDAMRHLQAALAAARQQHLTITPRGAEAARRSYAQTVALWASRVRPGLAHYVATGQLPAATAARIQALPAASQVEEIFALEAKGLFFSKDRSKSILYSVAPPGTSQHLSLLALDVSEFASPAVRKVLAAHGWYQTILSDAPHFTFLGIPENQLPGLGLKKVLKGGQVFYIPDL